MAVSPIIILAPAALAVAAVAAFFIIKGAYSAKPAHPPVPKETPSRQEVVKKDDAPAEKEKPSFFPIRPAVPAPPKLELSGIMYLDAGPKAIINGSVVKEGDLIQGATVKKIDPTDVVLDYGDVEIQLNLKD